jgi:phenylalanyl-tRNA synthetase beta subunit
LNTLQKNFSWEVNPVDIYSPEKSLKNITLRLEIHDHEKTIDTKFVGETIDKIAIDAERKLSAKII